MKKTVLLPKDTFLDKVTRFSRLWPIFVIGCLISTSLLVIYFFFQNVLLKLFAGLKAFGRLFKRKPKPVVEAIEEENVEEEGEETLPELVEADVVNNLKAQSNFAQVIQLASQHKN